MDILNIEIKIKIDNPERIESLLKQLNAQFVGEDHQIDTYFKVNEGLLKLREGNIENSLIWYNRIESKDLKKSVIKLQELSENNKGLKDILDKTLGIRKIVDKKRKIFYIDNVKFHIDQIENLGSFVEIEAIDTNGKLKEEHLKEQCEFYINLFGLNRENFIDKSYSDMIKTTA